ncbi:MAG: serine/threonine protein kinase [Flavisolibacter sp.]
MVSKEHLAFKATDRSYFAILKKEIHNLAVGASFTEAQVGELDIIVAEAVSNLVKHAGGGQVWVKLIEEDGVQGIEIISIDNGPGMADVSKMVADGVSTKNTLGQGLGAMKRLSSVFQVYSLKNWGTVILMRIFKEELSRLKKPPVKEIRSVVIPKTGEIECGDGFYYSVTRDHIKIFLGDGLGHGPEAAAAVAEAGKAFLHFSEIDPVEIIRYINSEVKKTRGLVGTVAVFDMSEKKWKICGVGNISTKIMSPANSKNAMAYNGIIGLNVPRSLNSHDVEYEKGQYIIMCSDGIKSKWDTVKYAAVQRYDASILAASLLKEYGRLTDDMSVAVCKINL